MLNVHHIRFIHEHQRTLRQAAKVKWNGDNTPVHTLGLLQGYIKALYDSNIINGCVYDGLTYHAEQLYMKIK